MIKLPRESLELLLTCMKNDDNLPVSENTTMKKNVVVNGILYYNVLVVDPVKGRTLRDELLEQVHNLDINEYTPEFYNLLRLIVTSEFCGPGLGEDGEPNEYGKKLDKLIQEIGSLFLL